jgi:hypothetical protein
MKMLVRPFSLAAFAALFLVGCIPQEGDTGTSSGSSGGGSSGATGGDSGATTLAGKACLDAATAFATAAQRCGGNYEAERAAFIKNIARGDCDSVSIRNESELRNMCFPSLGRITCNNLKEQRFDPSCAEQIIAAR